MQTVVHDGASNAVVVDDNIAWFNGNIDKEWRLHTAYGSHPRLVDGATEGELPIGYNGAVHWTVVLVGFRCVDHIDHFTLHFGVVDGTIDGELMLPAAGA